IHCYITKLYSKCWKRSLVKMKQPYLLVQQQLAVSNSQYTGVETATRTMNQWQKAFSAVYHQACLASASGVMILAASRIQRQAMCSIVGFFSSGSSVSAFNKCSMSCLGTGWMSPRLC